MPHARKSRHAHAISANSRTVRNINRAVILNFVREQQPISRSTIASLAHLNKSTVSSIVKSLIKEELVVEESGKARATKERSIGRNPISLRLKKGKNLVGAISFDSSTTQVAVIDIDGSVLDLDEISTGPHPTEEFMSRCVEMLTSMQTRHRIPPLRGIGVSVAGIVDSMQGRVVLAPNLGWENLDVSRLLRRQYSDPCIVAVENDAKTAALAELSFGQYDISLANFVSLSVGRGIGSGIVIDRRVLTGASNLAGEFGHIVIIEGGEPCACGNLGCWEAYASDRATVRRYAAESHLSQEEASLLTVSSVISVAKQGDPIARRELANTGRYLGMGIANIIKAVDPDAIIISGHIRAAWEFIVTALMEAVRARTFSEKSGNKLILPTSLTVRPSLLGAAAMVQRKMFTDVRVIQ